MKQILLLLTILAFHTALPSKVWASQIDRLDLAELERISKYIVIGEVLGVSSDKIGIEEIRVKVRAFLKGNSSNEIFLINLSTYGVKGFDPKLKAGDTGVFFLKSLENGHAEKAYFGSIALFDKPNFK